VKLLKRLFFFFILLVLIVIASGIVVSLVYGDEVKQKLVTEINKGLKTEISVGEIHFSVLRKFPNASLEFRDVLIKSVKHFQKNEFPNQFADTLLSAERLFLEFSLRSLISKQYHITSIQIEEGQANVLIDSRGDENYRFWETKEQGKELDFKIDLQNLGMYKVHILFSDKVENIDITSLIQSLSLSGNFSANQYTLKGRSEFFLDSLLREGEKYFGQVPLSTQLELDVNGDLYKVRRGQIHIGEMRFLLEGEYYAGGIHRIDVGLVGDNLNLKTAGSFLSGKYLDLFNQYNPYGAFIFNARMHGRYGRHEKPIIEGEFALSNGGLSKFGTNTKLSGLSAKGSFSNGRLRSPLSYSIELQTFSGTLGMSNFRGGGKIENLFNPYMRGNVFFDGHVDEVVDFIDPKGVSEASGKMKASISLNGYLEKLNTLTLETIALLIPDIKVEIQDGKLFLNEDPWQFDRINGRLQLSRNMIFDQLSLYHQGNHFLLSGELSSNVGNIFRKGATLSLEGIIHSEYLNLDVLLPEKEIRDDDKKVLLFPEKLLADLKFSCKEFYFRKFEAANIGGNVSYKPRMFVLNSINFESLDGRVSGGGAIIQKMNHDFLFQAQTTFQNVNISKLFYSSNNFSQDFITDSNLKGSLDGDLNFISEWTNDFDLIAEKIVADSRINISGGELVNFEPLNSLSKFIEVEELRLVRFSKLQNEIFIRNQIVTIPKMDIQSSAFNISVSGTHRFNNQFEYRLRVLLSEVLFSKARRAKKENEQHAIIEDDGLGRTTLPLIIAGTPDDYKISYDRRGAVEIIRQSLDTEKRNLRRILNEEFGWFSKDSADLKKDETQQKTPVYKIEWEEEDQKEAPPVKPVQTKEPEKKKFEITWEEEEKQDTTRRKKSS
jgi:hypothetical protein